MLPQTSQSAHNSPISRVSSNFSGIGQMQSVNDSNYYNNKSRRPSSSKLPLNSAQLAALNASSSLKNNWITEINSITRSLTTNSQTIPLPPISKTKQKSIFLIINLCFY